MAHAMRKLVLALGSSENNVVNVYPEVSYQAFEGFGGAITESAAWVYAQMDAAQRRELMDTFFGQGGMGYRFVRIPIDSCDFSLGQYEGWLPGNKADVSHLEECILPMLADAERVAGHKLDVVVSPWSPPAHMKDTGVREGGGRLLPACREAYAEYLCNYICELRARGVLVRRMTLQNEQHAVQTWDSCLYTAREEAEFLRDFLHPAMERHGIADVEVFLWDHNKERLFERMRDTIDGSTDGLIAGAAFHWYSGDHFEALDLCRQMYPGKRLMVSESCIEFSKFDRGDETGAALSLLHEAMGDLNHGASAFIDWNLLLDEQGGPNYVGNWCLAQFLYDTGARRLLRQPLQSYMERLAQVVVPGAVRLATTRFSDAVDATAWRHPNGTVALALLERTGRSQDVVVRMDGREATVELAPFELATMTVARA